MGLLNKLKNTFFEEEYVEVEEPIEEEKKVAKKVNIKEMMKSKKVKHEDELDDYVEEEKEEPLPLIEEEVEEEEDLEKTKEQKLDAFFSDRDLVNKNKKITEFDEEDFEPTVQMPVVVEKPAVPEKKIYGEPVSSVNNKINVDDLSKYSATSHRAYGATENPFHPTPIISPIYGILDKNYRKEEVIDKKDKEARLDENLDSVITRAYGKSNTKVYTKLGQQEIISEVEKMLEKGPAEEEKEYDPELEAKPVVSDVTVGDAEEYFDDLGLEYNVDYKDAQYENATGRRSGKHEAIENDVEEIEPSLEEVIINDTADETVNEDEDLTLEELINRNKEKELEDTANLEDNLFDLVDSMYGDGE